MTQLQTDPTHWFWGITSDAEPCGCRNAIDPASGILRRVLTCEKHLTRQNDPSKQGEKYYRDLGILDHAGNLARTAHVSEICDALGAFPKVRGQSCLEIGCGISPYAASLEEAGWLWDGLDVSSWAINHTKARGFSRAFVGDWETWRCPYARGMILAAHCLEHMHDAPGSLAKMAGCLKPGGELWLIVPDDTDRVNPDHVWFFTEKTLRHTTEGTGLKIERLASRQITQKEKYLYLRARKP